MPPNPLSDVFRSTTTTAQEDRRTSDWNPYLAGVALGLLLLAVFVVMGRGLGASGAFAACAGIGTTRIVPGAAEHSAFFARFAGAAFSQEWLVLEMIGVFIGAVVMSLIGRRVHITVIRGPHISSRARIGWAFLGGLLMACGARLAGGCTSSQILSGGALLNLGSWIFMPAVFIGAYALAYPMRRLWI